MENNIIKIKTGVSNWTILFKNNEKIELPTVTRETIVQTNEETVIYLRNAEHIENVKDKMFGKNILAIIQELEVFSSCGEVFTINNIYEDMYIFKCIDIGIADGISGFNIVFKSIKS